MQADWFWLILNDLKSLVLSIEITDLTYASYLVLWAVILLYPLHKVDRNDPIAGLMYVFYSLIAGTTLFFALPDNFKGFNNWKIHLGVLSMMGLLTCYRWFKLEDKDHHLLVNKEKL